MPNKRAYALNSFLTIKKGTPMLKVKDLSYSFPQKNLYQNVSFTLADGQHCAFIGASGSGKSTLIDMIMHPDDYMYEGDILLRPGCRIGYVSQFSQVDRASECTVFDYIAQPFIALQQQLTAICTEMETASELEVLLERYQETLDAYEALGGDDHESLITKQLALAGLSAHTQLPVSKLSGGEFKLVQVIKEMLTRPDLIIMDEPDVFLDFENINGLRDLINYHKGTMLVITHNRYLLNHCFNKIIHLENTELQEFDGRYIDYNFTLLQTKIEVQELAVADTLEIERNQEIIERLRTAATNYADAGFGKTLNARIKIQQRLEARRIKAPFVEIKEPAIHFEAKEEMPECTALTVSHYNIAFNHPLLEDVSFEIQAGDKVALIGPNGCGKTTLLRAIFKNDDPAIQIHEDFEPAFLSQLQGERLNESHTIQEEFFELGFHTYDEISTYLKAYGFDEEMMTHEIGGLSGGEKNLLQLAKISTGQANLLLLDEPTSHLDTYSQIALEKAIALYTGTVLMVSHDFYTIADCADYVLIVENKTVRKMSIRKFRKMIYANHFDKDYLILEEKKKELETRIEKALAKTDFETAKSLSEQLEPMLKRL